MNVTIHLGSLKADKGCGFCHDALVSGPGQFIENIPDNCFCIQISELLAGKEICVINGPSSNPKAALEKKIAECGGTFVQNPGR